MSYIITLSCSFFADVFLYLCLHCFPIDWLVLLSRCFYCYIITSLSLSILQAFFAGCCSFLAESIHEQLENLHRTNGFFFVSPASSPPAVNVSFLFFSCRYSFTTCLCLRWRSLSPQFLRWRPPARALLCSKPGTVLLSSTTEDLCCIFVWDVKTVPNTT